MCFISIYKALFLFKCRLGLHSHDFVALHVVIVVLVCVVVVVVVVVSADAVI